MRFLSFLRSLLTAGRGTWMGLSEDEAGPDPIALFGRWYEDARRTGVYLHEAVCLATATPVGAPAARMMLLKGFDPRGFRFFTNYGSRKADELQANDKAALLFHWSLLHRQVRVEGTVERISQEESAEYFRTRPRGSRIGAWASQQSSVLGGREQLEEAFRKYEREFDGLEVPLPPFWGGFRLRPVRIEFWQGRANRLHDRLVYVREGGDWKVVRLSP